MTDIKRKPIRRFSELSYIFSNILCALGVCLSAKSGLGVSTVVAPAYVISAYLEPKIAFFTFGNTEYVLQALVLVVLALVLRKITISYPLALVTAVLYGVTLDLWRLVFGTVPTNILYMKIIYMIVGALITQISIALIIRSYFPPQAYEFAIKEIALEKKINVNKVKWIYDVSSLIVAIVLMLILFKKFDFALIGVGTLIIGAVNAPLIAIFGKILDKFIDFSPFFKKFANKFFSTGKKTDLSENKQEEEL